MTDRGLHTMPAVVHFHSLLHAADSISMKQLCPGPVSRRAFLRVGTLGLGSMTLSELPAARARGSSETVDTSVILFWMWGGPSQFEAWDPKPDAPSEYR